MMWLLFESSQLWPVQLSPAHSSSLGLEVGTDSIWLMCLVEMPWVLMIGGQWPQKPALAKNTHVRRARRRVSHGMSHLNLCRGLSYSGGGRGRTRNCDPTYQSWGRAVLGWSLPPLSPTTRIWEQIIYLRGLPSGSAVKNLLAVQEPQETRVWPLGQEDPLKAGMATHSSILAWRLPMNRRAWRTKVHRVAKSHTQLKRISVHVIYLWYDPRNTRRK